MPAQTIFARKILDIWLDESWQTEENTEIVFLSFFTPQDDNGMILYPILSVCPSLLIKLNPIALRTVKTRKLEV